MPPRKTIATLSLIVCIGLMSTSLSHAADPVQTADPLQRILTRLRALGDVPRNWSRVFPAAERFVALPDFNHEAVLDRNTGLVWRTAPVYPLPLTFGEVRYRCLNDSGGGQKGWRLPSIFELASLVDPANVNPALPTGSPFGTDAFLSSNFYSGSVAEGYPLDAWVVHLGTGTLSVQSQNNVFYALCVRGGMNGDPH